MSLQMFSSGIVRNRNASVLICVFVMTLSGTQLFGEAGDLDPSFGGDGQITTDFGGAFDSVSDVAIRDDGHIVAVGTAGSSNRFGVAVYDANGAPDLGFDGDGKMILDQTGGDGAVLWTETGQILVSTTWLGGSFGFVVARLNSNGTYDTTFGSAGKRSIPMGSQPYVEAMCVQPDGKIVVAGYSYFSSNWSWALARFTSTGSIDTSFDGDGIVTTDFSPSGSGYDHAYGLAIQPGDGKIVAGGMSEDASGHELFTLARYNSNGSLDTSFGTGGKVVIPSGQIATLGAIYDIELLPNGKILACGFAGGDGIVLRFSGDGTLDTSFHSTGYTIQSFSTSNDIFNALTTDPLGRIIVACSSRIGSQWRQVVARFLEDGSLDPDFGTAGSVICDFGTPWEEAHDVALTPDLRILIGGGTGTANVDWNFSLARFLNEDFEQLELAPIDGEAITADGAVWDLDTTDLVASVVRSDTTSAERRGILEFNLHALPAEASVLAVELSLDIAGLAHDAGETYPFMEVYGYDGDGVLQPSDAAPTTGLLANSGPITGTGPIIIQLSDPAYIKDVQDRATHAGFVLRAGLAGLYSGFMTTEASLYGGLAPQLRITYLGPPPIVPADFDGDGDVDGDDIDAFDGCASGPAILLPAGCERFDLDGDGDGDQSDFAIVQRCLTGGG